jgi:transglutaminase-like putative cysteine protease
VWIGEGNEILKEKGMLGISFERTTREDVLFGSSIESSQDLTKVASIPSHVKIKDVRQLKRLELEINGIHQKGIQLDGGRQILKDNILVINKETLTDLTSSMDIKRIMDIDKKFLMPSLFVQSDHPKIINLVNKIIADDDNPLERANKIVDWIQKNIEKRPVLSLPDAVSTLTHRVGDCNEHAVLLAALARAAGIPTKVEAGLVYLNGRFYYHAWNLLYLGKWITADSLFDQIPADVTHIRLISGASSQQADLINIIGKIKLRINKVE